VKGFLGQWSEKRATLQDALGINSEPEPDTKHMGLDSELCGMAGPDASAGTETDDGCPGDKTRSDKVSEATIFRVKELTLEEIKDRLAARIKKVCNDATMSDNDVFHDAVEDLNEISGAGDLDGIPTDQEST